MLFLLIAPNYKTWNSNIIYKNQYVMLFPNVVKLIGKSP